MKTFRWCAGLILASTVILAPAAVAAELNSNGTTVAQAMDYRAAVMAVSAALAIAGSVIGAGYAVGRIGSAALGAAAEKPELLTRSILFVALAEGLAVLGFVIAMLLLQKI